MSSLNFLKNFFCLLLLGFAFAGCKTDKYSLFLAPGYTWEDFSKTKNSIILGKVSFTGIPGELEQVLVVFEEGNTEKVYPVQVAKKFVQPSSDPKKNRTNFYFFVQLPERYYHVQEVIAKHKTFEQLETPLLNANLTIPKNSIRYIGTILIKGIGPTLSMLGPVTESDIVDERKDVIKVFKEQYPQFKDHKIDVKVIDRYELFKDDGVGGKF